MQLVFVTNNASKTPEEVAEKLNQLGYSVEANQVITAATDLMTDLKERLEPGAKVLVVGTKGLGQLVTDAGFEVVPDALGQVDAVVQGFGPDVNWAELSEAAYAIAAGAAFFATNLDATLPTERGFALGNGALVAALQRATNKRAIAGGKPRPEIFTRAATALHMETPIVVGDRLNTDVAGAVAARLPSMHVLTGVNSARDVVLAQKGQRPSFVALDVGGLNEPHPRALHHRDNTWTCGVSQTVKVARAGVIEIGDIPLDEHGDEVCINLDTYRALIAAAWDYEDDFRRAKCPALRVVDNDAAEGTVTQTNRPQPVAESDQETGPEPVTESVVEPTPEPPAEESSAETSEI